MLLYVEIHPINSIINVTGYMGLLSQSFHKNQTQHFHGFRMVLLCQSMVLAKAKPPHYTLALLKKCSSHLCAVPSRSVFLPSSPDFSPKHTRTSILSQFPSRSPSVMGLSFGQYNYPLPPNLVIYLFLCACACACMHAYMCHVLYTTIHAQQRL